MELTVTKNMAVVGEINRAIIALAGPATISEVETIKSALLEALMECGELQLEVSEVTATDPAFLQLIHAARSSALKTGINFVLTGEFSAVFRETLFLAGFMPHDYSDDRTAQTFLKE